MSAKRFLIAVAVLASSMLTLQGRSQAPTQNASAGAQQPTSKATAVAEKPASHQSEGERIFEQNCNRCHNSPDGFSSRISGTVLHHMRVRASLSKHDEQELLRFFNP